MKTTFSIDDTISDIASNDQIDSRDMEALIDELEAIKESHDDWLAEDLSDRGDEPDQLNDDQAKMLTELLSVRDSCGSEWKYGVAYIRESHWTEYAQQLAEDVGAIPDDAKWPCNCIDWEEAASQLAQDYSQIDIDGTTFYYRD